MRGIRAFLAESRRRHVFRVAAWYGAVAWLLIQVAATVVPEFQLPTWVVRATIVALLGGLPVALLLAWAYDLTPSGPSLTSPSPEGDVASGANSNPLWRTASLWIALAAGALLGVTAFKGLQLVEARPESAVPAIAVLPFTSLTRDSESIGLSGGLHDAVISQLSKLSGLNVRSRTSVMKFQDWKGGLEPIADQLRVSVVLEGTVQRLGQRLIVNIQLVDAHDDRQLWAATLDRSSDDLFVIQSEIARQVVEALRITLTQTEHAALARRPTQDRAAYGMYLEASRLHSDAHASTFIGVADQLHQQAIELLERAVAVDPGLVLGYALLARLHADLAWNSVAADYRSNADAARRAAAQAIARGPEIAEAQLAHGIVQLQLDLDHAGAIESLERAVSGLPSSALARVELAVSLEQSGRWAEAIERYREGADLEPTDFFTLRRLANACVGLRDQQCQRDAAARAALVAPGSPDALRLAAKPARTADGDLGPLRQLVSTATDPAITAALAPESWLIRMADADYAGALRAVSEALGAQGPFDGEGGVERAEALRMLGLDVEARDTLIVERLRIERRLAAPSDVVVEAWHTARLGWVLARLGDRAGAIAAARRAEAMYSVAHNPAEGSVINLNVAYVYAAAGDRTAALERLRPIVNEPSWFTAGSVWTDWQLAELHSDPGFRTLVATQGIDVAQEPFAANRARATHD